MNITPVMMLGNVYNNRPKTINNVTSVNTTSSDAFVPSFRGYEKILVSVAEEPFKNEKKVEEGFDLLFSTLKNDKTIIKTEGFNVISNIYKKKGLRGLLHDLWSANQTQEVKKIFPKEFDSAENIAMKDGNPALRIINWGKFGVFYDKNTPYDMRLNFLLKKKSGEIYVDFGLNKKGEILTEQSARRTSIREFYNETGNVKKEVDAMGDTTYYNKDGSENFWKTFLWGGAPIYVG